MKMNLQRYTQDKACATPAGLKKKLLADLKPIMKGITPMRNKIIVATYVRPEVTAGGIIVPQKTQDEDRWQGKVGLVLKRGPLAFWWDEIAQAAEGLIGKERADAIKAAEKAHGVPQVGDWVQYRASESYEFGVKLGSSDAASCRYILDDSIITTLSDPSVIW